MAAIQKPPAMVRGAVTHLAGWWCISAFGEGFKREVKCEYQGDA
ncbi:MAG: hypothetical protein ACE5OS_10780 [Anaerolineae bacterium]